MTEHLWIRRSEQSARQPRLSATKVSGQVISSAMSCETCYVNMSQNNCTQKTSTKSSHIQDLQAHRDIQRHCELLSDGCSRHEVSEVHWDETVLSAVTPEGYDYAVHTVNSTLTKYSTMSSGNHYSHRISLDNVVQIYKLKATTS